MDCLISAVVTTYNLEKQIRESLQSVLEQSYGNLEVVISDDCSTDQTWNIINEVVTKYRRSGGAHTIILSRNEKNIGIMRNFEKAFSLAHGEIIVECDGDDISLSNRVSRIAEEFAKDRKLCRVIHNGIKVNENGRAVGHLFPINGVWSPIGAAEAYRVDKNEQWPLTNPDCFQDYVYAFRAIMRGKSIAVDEDLILYRVGSGATTSLARSKLSKTYWRDVCTCEQIKKDLEWKKNVVVSGLFDKISKIAEQRLRESRLFYGILASPGFAERWKNFKDLMSYRVDVCGLMRPGLWLDFAWVFPVVLFAPGTCDNFVECVARCVRRIREFK